MGSRSDVAWFEPDCSGALGELSRTCCEDCNKKGPQSNPVQLAMLTEKAWNVALQLDWMREACFHP